jgi:hypothetical protein
MQSRSKLRSRCSTRSDSSFHLPNSISHSHRNRSHHRHSTCRRWSRHIGHCNRSFQLCNRLPRSRSCPPHNRCPRTSDPRPCRTGSRDLPGPRPGSGTGPVSLRWTRRHPYKSPCSQVRHRMVIAIPDAGAGAGDRAVSAADAVSCAYAETWTRPPARRARSAAIHRQGLTGPGGESLPWPKS